MIMTKKEIKNFFAHFPNKVSNEMVDFATNTVFLGSRYVFIRRVKDEQYGYCTHCKNDYMTGIKPVFLLHNQDWKCPKCKSLVIVKQQGMGRKNLFSDAYFVWYEKSLIDPEAIVARGIYAYRDYTGDYRKMETKFTTVAAYLFKPGKSQMLRREFYWSKEVWREPKSIISETENSMKSKAFHISLRNIAKAVQGTPFEYSTWEKYTKSSQDLIRFFDLASRYPCIEYLTKLGFRKVVEAKICGGKTYGAINWRGKTIEKVLRLSKHEMKELKKSSFIPEPLLLHSYHYFKKIGFKVTFEEAYALSRIVDTYYFQELKKMSEHAPIIDISKFILKQLRRKDAKEHYYSSGSVLIALRDYWEQCKELGMDLTREHVKFPNSLHEAHQKTTKKIKIKEDKELNELIAKRLKHLNKYTFEYNGLLIRPAKNSEELFEEGKALIHCVGSYSKRYAEGQTNIFLIRRINEPDKPFYTVEIINNIITQVYGYDNCLPTEEVKMFMEAFKSEKLQKNKNERKRVAV